MNTSPQTVCITFLGRTPRGEDGYRTTRYEFGDGTTSEPLAFFGWALHERLKPGRLVVLGTAGSMWDHLFEGDFDLGSEAEDERLALTGAVEAGRVDQDRLDRLAPLLAERLGCEVRLRLIPYCRDEAEQVELLRIMAGDVEPGDRVDLDVTHGFRHLPMLALLAALHLRRVREAEIAHIWYGAYDPDTGRAPVHDLAGLLKIADWIEALAVYERSGDYGVFAGLIGGETGGLLAKAGFLETVNRIGQARTRLRDALKRIEQPAGDPALPLFRDELRRRIGWAEGENYYLRQRELAYEYLRRGRHLNAVLTGWEAFTTRLQHEGGRRLDPDNPEHRDQVRRDFDARERRRHPRSDRYRAYDTLRRLRNAVAHGSQPKGEEVQRALSDREAMEHLLRELFAVLLPEAEENP